MSEIIPEKFWSGGFLYNPKTHSVFLHKRDGNTKFNPNAWAFFGGLCENNETPIECFIRELNEEIGLNVSPNRVKPLCDYLNVELSTYRYVFFVESDAEKETFTLGEGAGFDWVMLSHLDSLNLTEKTKRDLNFFLSHNFLD